MRDDRPYYYFKCWRGQGKKINGETLTLWQYQMLLRHGAALFSFPGRAAVVCIVIEDSTLSRKELLEFATMFVGGEYVTVSVDLEKLTSTTTNGKPPPGY